MCGEIEKKEGQCFFQFEDKDGCTGENEVVTINFPNYLEIVLVILTYWACQTKIGKCKSIIMFNPNRHQHYPLTVSHPTLEYNANMQSVGASCTQRLCQ